MQSGTVHFHYLSRMNSKLPIPYKLAANCLKGKHTVYDWLTLLFDTTPQLVSSENPNFKNELVEIKRVIKQACHSMQEGVRLRLLQPGHGQIEQSLDDKKRKTRPYSIEKSYSIISELSSAATAGFVSRQTTKAVPDKQEIKIKILWIFLLV